MYRVTAITTFAEEFPRGHVIAPHRHVDEQVVYAKSGVMRVVADTGTWVLPPHRALWMPSGMEHAIRCASAVAMRTVYLADTAVSRLDGSPAVLGVSPLLREVILRLVEGGGPAGQEPHLAALLTSELSAAHVTPLHLPEPRDPRLVRLCRMLEADPGDPRSLAQLAPHAGAAVRTLARLFLRETGMTFSTWQRQLRLLEALERLAAGHPVTTVALELGYESPSAFIAAFRQALGVTPGRYFATLPVKGAEATS